MKFKFVCAVFLVILVTAPVVGQGFFGSRLFGSPSLFGSHIGVFPAFRVPRPLAPLFLVDHFLFGDLRPTRIGGGTDRFPVLGHPGIFSAYRYNSPNNANYSSRNFVEQWKGRNTLAEGVPSSFAQSVLLSEGMAQEQVVRRLGSPVQRIRLGEREVWKYSAYSLLFEAGLLKEIR